MDADDGIPIDPTDSGLTPEQRDILEKLGEILSELPPSRVRALRKQLQAEERRAWLAMDDRMGRRVTREGFAWERGLLASS